MTEYRTPAGTQNETRDEDHTCCRCGGPLGSYDRRIQGADPDVLPFRASDGIIPKHCQRCSLALSMGPGYR